MDNDIFGQSSIVLLNLITLIQPSGFPLACKSMAYRVLLGLPRSMHAYDFQNYSNSIKVM